ncbi:type VI secretion system amidase effector protein Tae4 [Salmonella enterica]|nr:hypothetical protein [Salmonella enterica]HBJ6324865.1 type VI secretion system amidase effector protein Tae4 [Salmonella enterica subsp. enterica serovar Nima]ECD9271370.1 hypothetical protein [Salmonella enterica]ECH3056977.1 hypothetical protein [Salmonella enterica]ECJ2158942.1 hypothetical protein [Salmonella enterica]
MNRPSFNEAWLAFRKVNHSVADVGSIIGGNVGKNITGGYFQNACPIRMSYVLNATGFPIARNSPYAKVSGADNKFYIYRVNDMIDHLTHNMGKPDLIVNNPKQSDFIGKKGIIVVKGHGWSNARGHVTLWKGSICSDQCHLLNDPDNGPFVPEVGTLWILP